MTEPPDARSAGDAATLEGALRAEGIDARVEARERLAIVIPGAATVANAELRARVWSLAREAGFTHAALELVDDGAALHRD